VCPEKALDLMIENTPPVPGIDPALRVSLSRGSEEPGPTVDTTLRLQKCIVCGEVMPVTGKYLDIIKERMFVNLKPETGIIVEKDMERYLRTCISCRRKYSLEWDTHPRKFI
jgi:hydrogenase-4 component H